MGKSLYKKILYVKLRAFGLKISTFPCLLVVANCVTDLVAFTMA